MINIESKAKSIEQYEKPQLLNSKNIIYWSASLKQLEGVKEGSAIKTKALKFIRDNKVIYDSINKVFIVLHIEGYNNTDYIVKADGDHFSCTCQFYNKVSKFWDHPRCSHIQSVLFTLEMNRWNNKAERF